VNCLDTLHAVPCQVEVAHTLSYFFHTRVAPDMPSEAHVRQLLAITNGNGAELRKYASHLTVLDMNML
jgi:hypothetical protein